MPETIVLEDSGISISVGDGVYATHGTNNKGASYYWAGSKWEVSQRKTTKNQNPIFAMFDGNGTNFKDYTANNWTGNNLFHTNKVQVLKDSEIGIFNLQNI